MKLELERGVHLYRGDCLEVMPTLEVGSIDMVMTDPPYGTTECKWDSVIPIDKMWDCLLPLVDKKAAMVFTASQPFTTVLIGSKLSLFKYCWVWDKVNRPTGHLNAKRCRSDRLRI